MLHLKLFLEFSENMNPESNICKVPSLKPVEQLV